MRGLRPHIAEIAGRPHDPTPEMMLPDSIDDDPRRKGVGSVRDSLRQFQTPAAFRKGLGFAVAQERGQLARRRVSPVVDITADGHPDIMRVLAILDGLEERILYRECLLEV